MNNIKLWHQNIVKIDSIYKMNISNSLQSYKITDITLNICSNSIINDSKSILYYMTALRLITNQDPIVCKARKSLALFKVRKGILVGTKVTLRRESLYNFLSLFIFLVLPNLKDLVFVKPNKKSFSIGIKNLLIFPQLSKYYDRFPRNMSSIINFNTNGCNEDSFRFLFSSVQLPIK